MTDRRGGGTAGGFEAERRACAGTDGGAREEFAEFRRAVAVVAVGVRGLVAGIDWGSGDGRCSDSSGILSTLASVSSSAAFNRLPRHRLVLGGSGLIFGLGLLGWMYSVPGGRFVRLGVMMPGFSC